MVVLTGEQQAEAKELLAANTCGEPVGYQVLWEDVGRTPCPDGCLAPGSSPHYHACPAGYVFLGTAGWVRTDANLAPQAAGRLYAL